MESDVGIVLRHLTAADLDRANAVIEAAIMAWGRDQISRRASFGVKIGVLPSAEENIGRQQMTPGWYARHGP